MSFVNTQYTLAIIIGFLILLIIMMRQTSKYFTWIKSYWFLDRSFASRLSNLFYYLSIFLFLISLLDLRGPEKKIKGALPDQKTIIMIDNSLSMLSEDVRPNRFLKAVQLARHFVKNSAGHQLSIVVFSDTQKRLLPFTDDVDLIDSRLAALENTSSVAGGTSLSQALTEVAGYFEAEGDSEAKDTSGNILVFTDGEENDDNFKVNLPANINLAVVGIGTAKGGNIPLRWEDGSFRGYKQVKNEPVITKLNENFIKSIGKDVKNYNFWIVNSYSMPTDEILNFFRATYNKVHNNGDMRIRPVYSHYILIPAIVLYCLSVLIGRFPTFKSSHLAIILLISLFGFNKNIYAQENKKPLSSDVQSDLEKMKTGKSSRKDVLKTAEKLLRENADEKAEGLYQEYLKSSDEENAKFNYATSLMKQGKVEKALPIASELLKKSSNEELKSKLRSNLVLAIKNSQNPNKKKDKNQEQQDKDQNKDQKQDQQNKDQKQDQQNKDQKQDQNKDQKQNQQNKDQKQDQQNKDQKQGQQNQQSEEQKPKKDNGGESDKDKNKENKEKDKKKEEKKKDKKEGDEDENDKEDQSPKSLEEKEKQIEQKRRTTKIPGMVKQIMNDDRELQKKLMDTSTKEKGEMKPKNDW